MAVRAMLETGIDINTRDDGGQTLCMVVAKYNRNPDILKLFIQKGAQISEPYDNDIPTPLCCAVDGNNYANCVTLIKAGADISEGQHLALHYAVELSYITLVLLLLESGADPNSLNPSGNALLTSLPREKTNTILKLLLRFGANPNTCTSSGKNIVFILFRFAKAKALVTLIQAGANVNHRDNRGRFQWYKDNCRPWSMQDYPYEVLYVAGAQISLENLGGSRNLSNSEAQAILARLPASSQKVTKYFNELIMDISMATKSLGLPALITCEILQAVLFRWPRLRFCDIWNRVTLIKHFEKKRKNLA